MAKVRAKDVINKYNAILADLKKKIFHPVYLLMGEESYYIDELCNYMSKNILSESEKAFNQLVLYGKDVDAKTVFFAAARPPMMASHQVVIVKEAQHIKKFDDLDAYLKAPLKTTILIICHKEKSVNKNLRFYKAIDKHGVVFETAKPYDSEIPAWINSFLATKGATIAHNAAAMLADAIGSDLTRIANELEKLFILLPQGNNQITADHIEKNIGISKDFNVFELNKAIGIKDVYKANQIIHYFGQNPNNHPAHLTVLVVFGLFCKMLRYQITKRNMPGAFSTQIATAAGVEPYFAADYENYASKYTIPKIVEIIGYLREYDLRSKGWNNAGTSDKELMRELIFKIMH